MQFLPLPEKSAQTPEISITSAYRHYLEQALQKKEDIFLVTGDTLYRSQIQTLKITGDHTRLKHRVKESLHLSRGAAHCLIPEGSRISYSPEFTQKFLQWNQAGMLSPIEIHIQKDGPATRVTLHDGEFMRHMEIKLSLAKWSRTQEEIVKQMRLIDQALPQGDTALYREAIQCIRAYCAGFLPETSLRLFPVQPFRNIIIYGGVQDTLPWELLFPDNTVSFAVPVPAAPSPPKGVPVRFCSIYGPDLPAPAREAGLIVESMQNHWEVESFSDDHFQDYTSSLIQADILHFAGHGREQYHKGQIRLQGAWHESLPPFSRLRLLTLNACSCGKSVKGIVGRSLEQGAGMVLASPYRIPDRDWVDFTRFYRHLSVEHIYPSLSFFQLLEPRLGRFYRIFRPLKQII